MEGRARYLANLRYTACVRVEENFCSIRWETDEPGSFSWGAPFEGNLTARGASGGLCNVDDFIGIDQGSAEGSGPGEDRLCGTKLLQDDYVICKFTTVIILIIFEQKLIILLLSSFFSSLQALPAEGALQL